MDHLPYGLTLDADACCIEATVLVPPCPLGPIRFDGLKDDERANSIVRLYDLYAQCFAKYQDIFYQAKADRDLDALDKCWFCVLKSFLLSAADKGVELPSNFPRRGTILPWTKQPMISRWGRIADAPID